MAASDFQNRWAKQKQPGVDTSPPSAAPVARAEPDSLSGSRSRSQPASKEQQPPPTMDDVAKLSPDSDFSAFVAKGVDENVKRSAMKKLFSDPHFNIMDRLDIYIDDYTKFEPIPPEMVAMLDHAKTTLNPLLNLQSPAMRMISGDDAPPSEKPDALADAEALPEDEAADTNAEEEGAGQAPQTAGGEQESDTTVDPGVEEATAGASGEQTRAGSAIDGAGADAATDHKSQASPTEQAGTVRQDGYPNGAIARPDEKS